MYRHILLAGLCFASTHAVAAEIKLSCELDSGSVHQGCKINPTSVVNALPIDAEVRLDYVFNCRGHESGLVFTGGNAPVRLAYGKAETQTAILYGPGPFVLTSSDQETTYRATLVGPCTIQLGTPRIEPSLNQVQLWHDKIQLQAKIINLSIDLYLVCTQLRDLKNWDAARLVMLKDKLTSIHDRQPLQWTPNLKALLDLAGSTISGQPVPILPTHQAGVDELLPILHDDMLREGAEGSTLVDLLQKYQKVEVEVLRKAVCRLNKMSDTASTCDNGADL